MHKNLINETIDALGAFTPTVRDALEELLKNPTQKNWSNSFRIILNIKGLSLQQACGGVKFCPTRFVLLRALQQARVKK